MIFVKSLVIKHYKMCRYISKTFLCTGKFCRISSHMSSFHKSIEYTDHKFTKRKSLLKLSNDNFSTNSPDFTETEIEEVTGVYPFVENQSPPEHTTVMLFSSCRDSIIQDIEKCASVKEVFNFVKSNIEALNYKHLTKIVVAIHDLQHIFLHHCDTDHSLDSFDQNVSELREKFFKKLLEHQEFYMVTESIETNLNSFDATFLSYTLWYLVKLGVPVDSHLVQNMAVRLRDLLLDKFSLSDASRLLRVLFLEDHIRPFYTVIDLIPTIFEQIEKVETAEDLEDLSVCLKKLRGILTNDILQRYEAKINQLIGNKSLPDTNYQVILKVLSVFCTPDWRSRHCTMISKCILFMKNSIESLNYDEICHLYDIFFKNQEPGEALNAIQRAAAKLLREIDDTDVDPRTKLRLFSSAIFFASPTSKEHFRKHIGKYISEKETVQSLTILRKLFTFLKISDPKLWDDHWNKACQLLKEEKDFYNVIRLIENYVYFCVELSGYRHYAFEHHVLNIIQRQFDAGLLTLSPSRFFISCAFVFSCSYNVKLIERLLQTFTELSTQLDAMDIYKLSLSMQIFKQRRFMPTPTQVEHLRKTLQEATARLYTYSDFCPDDASLLGKASILRGDPNNELMDDMLVSLKNSDFMSSKILNHTCFTLYNRKTLIPEVVNKCTEYIIRNKSHIVAFNAEKVLDLLYQFNYQPVYEDEFFATVTDVIIRDQDRISGLSFLQDALSLCFFQRMPKSFIKQIFNVQFLDKLDIELTNCYFKDRYPQRVKDILMQLNRAVCLEYPEYDVPWFHQKYIEEFHKSLPTDDVASPFQRSVKGYILGIFGSNNFLETVITPYGYTVNFVLHLDKNNTPTDQFEDPFTSKVAILLKHENAFTRLYVRLMGKHALKNRHLEILGYKVKMIKRDEWYNLLYAKERVDFIEKIVFS